MASLFFVCDTCPHAFYSTSAFFHRPCTQTIAIIVSTHNSNIKAEQKTMLRLHQRQSRQMYPWHCVECCGAKNAMQAWQSFWAVLQGKFEGPGWNGTLWDLCTHSKAGGVVGGITEMRTVYDLEPTGLRGPGAETFCSIWEGI